MKLGSLFDGSGGFPLAGMLNGIEPRWLAEIEPYPCRVTAKRFPCIPNHGDVTKISGAEIEPVDIVTFGSPCQDLSVAGKQAGIHEGARSSLFFEAVRIIKEMRDATSDHYPRFAVWENVPGAFSSNRGEDFRAVLRALCEIKDPGADVPEPPRGGWKHAGCVVGNGYSIAWRVYDAQYWGVPQRRKRIYLIADFGSERAGEILFESESVSGDSEQSGTERQDSAGDAAQGAGGSDCIEGHIIDRRSGQNGRGWAEGYAHTLNATDHHGVCYAPEGNFCGGYSETNISATLETRYHYGSGGDAAMMVYPILNHSCYPEIARSLCARADSSPCVDRRQNIICYDARGNGEGGVCPTITGDHENRITDYTAICIGIGANNETDTSDDGSKPLRKDEPWLKRTGCERFAVCIGNGQTNQSLGGGIGSVELYARPTGGGLSGRWDHKPTER